MKIITKFEAAVSDTDILIDLYRTGTLDLLKIVFNKVIIPDYIYSREIPIITIKFKDDTFFGLKKYIEDNEGYIVVVKDSDMLKEERMLKNALIKEIKDIAGRGEVECVSYAHATGIRIVVSNNHREFDELNKPIPPLINTYAIMVNYYHILTIAYLHEKIDKDVATEYYDKINKVKGSSHNFGNKIDESIEYFKDNKYVKILKLENAIT
ncbi:MAG: hypothetical protein CVV00_11860 [Firmicutes bacterium HGW-Firmicutes-5]|nr:MAG: hypothetical protein CVV00_11860 [Firmicutes bacterium HGW-Firmicutes-5]